MEEVVSRGRTHTNVAQAAQAAQAAYTLISLMAKIILLEIQATAEL